MNKTNKSNFVEYNKINGDNQAMVIMKQNAAHTKVNEH